MKWALPYLIVLGLGGCCSPPAEHKDGQQGRLVRFEQDGKFGFMDGTGRVVVKPIYDDAGNFGCGLAPVNEGSKAVDIMYPRRRREGGKWGYINAQGKVIVPLTFRWARAFSEGLAQVCDDAGLRFIDASGKTAFTLGKASSAGDFSEGLAPVCIDRSLQKQDAETRFVNRKGETVFTVDGYAEGFHEGMAVFIVRDDADPQTPKKYGFIDITGKVVVAPRFAEAHRFREGLAPVRPEKTGGYYGMGDAWGYIDTTGEYVLEPAFSEAHLFYGGVARVHVGGSLRTYQFHQPPVWEGGEWQLINRQGEVLKRSQEWVTYDDTTTEP